MIKTIQVNIGGIIFHVNEDAYDRLKQYLDRLRSYFKKSDDPEEVVADIESRIAELLHEMTEGNNGVDLSRVEAVIAEMGMPEDFEQEGFEHESENIHSSDQGEKRFFRDRENSIIGGVCAGIGAYYHIDPLWLRLAFVLVVLFSFGSALLIYVVLWIIIPPAKTIADRLQMRGEKVNVSNIEKNFKEGISNVKEKMGAWTDEAKNWGKYHNVRAGKRRFRHGAGTAGRILLKIIGALFIIIALATLITILLSILGVGLALTISLPTVAQHFVEGYWTYIFLVTGIMLFAGVPLLALITKGLAYLTNTRIKNRWIFGGGFALWFAGVILLTVVGIKTTIDFTSSATYTQTYHLNTDGSDTLHLRMEEDITVYGHDDLMTFDDYHLRLQDDSLYIRDIGILISDTDDSTFSLVIHHLARGSSYTEALDRAKRISYKPIFTDNTVRLPQELIVNDRLWRNQKVRIILKVPEGKNLDVSRGAEPFISRYTQGDTYWME